MGDLDISLRAVASLMPEDLAAVTFPGARVEVRGWRESQLATMERRMDDLLELAVNGRPVLAHYEWMERWAWEAPGRMFEYHTLTMITQLQQIAARRAEALAQRPAGDRTRILRERPLRITSTAVVLSGPRRRSLRAKGGFRTSLPEDRHSGVRFRVIAVYQRSVDELLAMPGRLWAVFTPAARDASVETVARAVRTVEQRVRSKTELGNLLATMELVAESQGALEAVQEMLMKVIESKGIETPGRLSRYIREEGRKEGLGAVVRQIERKVGHALTAEERSSLYAHATAEGVERVGDVVLDLDGPALTAWLASPAA